MFGEERKRHDGVCVRSLASIWPRRQKPNGQPSRTGQNKAISLLPPFASPASFGIGPPYDPIHVPTRLYDGNWHWLPRSVPTLRYMVQAGVREPREHAVLYA